MGHEYCDCTDFHEGGGAIESWVRWLDKRNEARAAWVVLTQTGKLESLKGLAATSEELRELGREERQQPKILRTKDEMWALHSSPQTLAGNPLERLDAKALERFFSGVQFEDYVEDGQRFRHVGTYFMGDLVESWGFTQEELFQVAALFGIGPELAVRSYHKFGWDVDRARCQPRRYFVCPWTRDC